MTNYNIQQTVHLLPLPNDITNIINSYLFYDKITGETRKKMKDIVETFYFACQTRVRSYISTLIEDDEYWSIWMADIRLDDVEDSSEIQFHGANCKVCGEYKMTWSPPAIPLRCICRC